LVLARGPARLKKSFMEEQNYREDREYDGIEEQY
jgi:hypothetical protein